MLQWRLAGASRAWTSASSGGTGAVRDGGRGGGGGGYNVRQRVSPEGVVGSPNRGDDSGVAIVLAINHGGIAAADKGGHLMVAAAYEIRDGAVHGVLRPLAHCASEQH